ncbi:MAG: alpha/beta fold hydrolase, partial [Microscillaceae bacterium]|nr:alpha/beta fold hydrolase [Microscillaceae bacterium]
MLSEIIPITFKDDTSTQIEILAKSANSSQAILVLMPAMGMSSKYYKIFAEYLATHLDITTVITDLRGLGHSSVRASRQVDFGYQEIINDYTHLLQILQQKFPQAPIYLLGHSLGGQIACLLATHQALPVKGLILIACGSNYYKMWRGFNQIGSGGFMLFTRLLAQSMGYFPGKKVGFGGTEAKTLIQDWSYMGLYGKYKIKNSAQDYEKALAQTAVPILAMGIQNDGFAPAPAIDFLVKKFKQLPDNQHLTVTSAAHKLTHFNWLKYPELFG